MTRSSTRKGEVAIVRAPGVRWDSFSESLASFAGAEVWRARAAATSSEKMVSPRSAVRYCTTSFHCFLYSSFCALVQGFRVAKYKVRESADHEHACTSS